MITLLPTPIGNLGDISLRTLEVLAESEIVLCEDTRVTKKLLSLLQKSPIISSNFPEIFQDKVFYPFHSHNQREFLAQRDRAFFDKKVVFLSDAGMPCVSDPGALLVAYAQEHGIAYDVLPGSNACVLAYCMSGVEDSGFVFGGFLPHKKEERKKVLLEYFGANSRLSGNQSIIFYESPHRILDSLADLAALDRECKVFAIKEMTKINQKFFTGSAQEVLGRIKGENIKGEWVLVLNPTHTQERVLSLEEIEQMSLPPKVRAKLLAKLTGQDPKAIYQNHIEGGE